MIETRHLKNIFIQTILSFLLSRKIINIFHGFLFMQIFFFQSLFHMLMIEILLIDQFIARYSALFLSSLGLCLFGRQEHCQCSIILNHQTIKLKIRTKSHMFAILFIALVYNLSIIVLDHHRWLCRLSVQCQGSSWISTIS